MGKCLAGEQNDSVIDKEKILCMSGMGLWKIEIEEGKQPRFYADQMMNELLGTQASMTPEERFVFHRNHIHPDDMKSFKDYSDELMTTSSEIVYRYIHPISGEMIVRCSGSRDNSDSAKVCLMGMHQNITETVRIEQGKVKERYLAEKTAALKRENFRQETYYRDLLDVQNCGLLAYTMPGHKIIHMNAEALRIYDVKDIQEMQLNLGKILGNIYYPDSKTIAALKNLRENDDVVDYECIINKGSSNECHIMAKTKVLEMLSGERAVITTFLDVSDMVTLRRALKQAQEGSQAKSSFLSRMSHDIRTPLNGIIGLLEIDAMHPDDIQMLNANREKMRVAADHLLALINDVLQMSKLESGDIVIAHKAMNLGKISNDILTIINQKAAESGITMLYDDDDAASKPSCITTVYGSPLHLRQIFLNIYTNCIKYNKVGGTVRTSLECLGVRNHRVTYRWVISDTGIGMSKDFINHIFEPFSQEHCDARSVYQGTGLGMAIVRELIEKMHGTIEITSEEGVGSTFVITIPFEIIESPVSFKKEDEQIADITGMHLMLVEDNELNAEIMEVLLKDKGANITIANDGKQAVELFESNAPGTFDIILMDVMMPVMDGLTATKNIRALPRTDAKSIPIIAMTANAFEEDARDCIAAGMNAHLAKPVQIDRLMKVLGEMKKQTGIKQKNEMDEK